MIYQLTGQWQCNKEHLQKIRERVLSLIRQVGDDQGDPVTLEWIPREQNEAADALSRIAYEQATGEKFPERKKK